MSGLFEGAKEKIHLWLPAPFVVLAAAEFVSGKRLVGSVNGPWLSALIYVVLLNNLHNAFTAAVALELPEMREWVRLKSDGRPGLFWAGVAALFIVLIAGFYGAGGLMGGDPTSYALALFGADAVLNMHHRLSQWRGLAAAYTEKLAVSAPPEPAARGRAAFCRAVERHGFTAFIASTILLRLVSWTGLSAAYRPFWAGGAPFRAACAFSFLSAAAIFAAACLQPGGGGSTKRWFLLRLALGPLMARSVAAYLGVLAVHGVEYLFVCDRLARSSAAGDGRALRRFYIAMTVLSVGLFFISWPRIFMLWLPAPGAGLRLLASVSCAVTWVHFYLDRVFYRMRDPLTRATTGRLLLGRPALQSST